jgi:protein-S-isoprenylcysteine O-methyltransferase Ste14
MKRVRDEVARAVWLNGLAGVIYTALLAAVLILVSGRADWVAGWLFVGVYAALTAVSIISLYYHDPDLLVERSSMPEGTKSWDRVLSIIVARVGPVTTWVVCGLEARWNQPGERISPVVWVGLALMLLGYALSQWAMLSNPFFSGVMRIQVERGHTVVQHGPYRLVRHPGYVGMILSLLAAPLILTSRWGWIPAGLTAVAVVVRTALEDRALLEELPGYAEYAGRVRWRLAPGVW